MPRTTILFLLCSMLLTGCAGTKSTSEPIRTTRVYAADKVKLIEHIRMYCKFEEFRLGRCEVESGKVIAYKDNNYIKSNEARTILMNLSLTSLGDNKTEISSKFSIVDIGGTVTNADQSLLSDYYEKLFKSLDEEFLD